MKKASVILLFLIATTDAFAQSLAVNPFIGHISQNEIRGWAMFKKVDSVRIRLWSEQDTLGQQQTFYFDKHRSFKKYLPVHFAFRDLKAGTSYHLSYTLNNDESILIPQVSTADDTLTDLSFLAGSCAFIGTGFNGILKPGNDLRIFSSMQRDSADMMIWLGDNLYYILQAHTYKKQLKRNVKTRLNTELAEFLNSKQQYAIWDDHDYGTNNSDGSFKHKDASLDVFKQFWPNAQDENASGNYFTFQREDVQFFMLDDRFENEAAAIVLGQTQLQWLKEGLLKSGATFKFICIGMQALNPQSTMECFAKTKEEYNSLVNYIQEEKINGVLFLSGDRHHGELLKLDAELGYPLYDITASPLTMYPVKISSKSPEYNNPQRVPGTYFPSYNYAKVRINGPVDNRQCTLLLFDRDGRLVWSHGISAHSLKF